MILHSFYSSCNITNLWTDSFWLDLFTLVELLPTLSQRIIVTPLKLFHSDFDLQICIFLSNVTKWAFKESTSLTARPGNVFRIWVQLKFTKHLRVNPAVWTLTADWWMWLWTFAKMLCDLHLSRNNWRLGFFCFVCDNRQCDKLAPHRFNTTEDWCWAFPC